MSKQLFFSLFCWLMAVGIASAQELTVKSMEAAPMDLSASQYRRPDKNERPCALVKVQLTAKGAVFGGNVIGDVEYKTNEYWVYMSEGSYMLNIKHPDYLSLMVNFRDYGIRSVESLNTYKLVIAMPVQENEVKTQKLVINYTPKDAMVLIDSKPYTGNGHVEAELPDGDHTYMVIANGYVAVKEKVKLKVGDRQEISKVLEKAPSFMETFMVEGVVFRMVRVEGGTFKMGNKSSWLEKPVHQVAISSFFIGETEVTQELWEAVMGSNPSHFKGSWRPVERVSWNECQQFIKKLNAMTGRQFRLPTEAEWEFAARGGNKSHGYTYSGSNTLADVAWYDGNSGGMTRDVALKLSNELGLYDMSGNVCEWCQDFWGAYGKESQTNPMGPVTGDGHVTRNGSWISLDFSCRCSSRGMGTGLDYFTGLRLAL